MFDWLRPWAHAHPILWLMAGIVLVLLVLAILAWRNSARTEWHRTVLFLLMVVSVVLGGCTVWVALLGLPAGLGRESALSFLGISLSLCTLFSFFVAGLWVESVASKLESEKKKAIEQERQKIGTRIGVLPPSG
jgi:heme A synthase